MSIKVSSQDGVKVYTVAGGKNIPSWLSDKKKKSLKKDEEYRRRVELIQDFDFPAACQRIKITPDSQYIFATGYHPPRVRVYDVNQLSMKFERHLDAEIVDFQILTDDYSKAVFLCTDRSLNFHARFGGYYKTRIPRFGRDLSYCPFTAELVITSSSPEIYRMSLSEGRFMSPLIARSPAINACGMSPSHGMLACAGEDGGLECFDVRQRESLGWMDAAAAAGGKGQGLTALRFDASGMSVAVGTSGGLVALFDLRSQRPIVVKDHMYDSPIVDIKFHSGKYGDGRQHVISSDRHIIKIWDASNGEGYTNIEPSEGHAINDVAVWQESGLIMAACDSSRIQAYFVPSLGPAPRWCSFLESLTEELEESANPTLYDDYRFITRADLDKLGLDHLIGTPLLRAYMHGFFVDNRLYHKAKSISDPFAYETYREKRIAQKIEDERKSRISLVRKLPKVNAATAARIMIEQSSALNRAAKDAAYTNGLDAIDATTSAGDSLPTDQNQALKGTTLLEDDRFRAMFEDPEFTIDEDSYEYRLLHPNVDPKKERKLLAEHFEELETGGGKGKGGDSGTDGLFAASSSDDDDDGEDEEDERKRKLRSRQQGDNKKIKKEDFIGRRAMPKMFAAKDDVAAAAFRQGKSLSAEREMPLGERGQRAGNGASSGGVVRQRLGGSREMSFVPRMRPEGGRGRGRGGEGGGRGGGRRGRGGGRGRGRR